MKRIYLDAAPVIYATERPNRWADAVDALLTPPDVVLVSSALTRMECLVVPLRCGDLVATRRIERFFREAVQETVGLTDSVLDLAASIRARFGFRTPDAIHLAAAMAAHCDQFLTNDRSLRAFSEVTVVVVDDLVAEANADTDEITGDT